MSNRDNNEEASEPWTDDSEFPYDERLALEALRSVYEADPLERKMGRHAAVERRRQLRHLRELDAYAASQTPSEADYPDQLEADEQHDERPMYDGDGVGLGYFGLIDPYGDETWTPGLN